MNKINIFKNIFGLLEQDFLTVAPILHLNPTTNAFEVLGYATLQGILSLFDKPAAPPTATVTATATVPATN